MEFHVRHIALPAPGDWRQLMIQVARLHSRPLDRTRPMWEVYVIEGLDNIPKLPPGSFALFSKFHHASVDGMAGAHLALQLHSTRLLVMRRPPQNTRSMLIENLRLSSSPPALWPITSAVLCNSANFQRKWPAKSQNLAASS